LVLRFTTEVVNTVKASDATFAEMQRHFSPREIVELLLAIGFLHDDRPPGGDDGDGRRHAGRDDGGGLPAARSGDIARTMRFPGLTPGGHRRRGCRWQDPRAPSRRGRAQARPRSVPQSALLLLPALLSCAPAWATNHEVRIDEVMAGANGDAAVQFVELAFSQPDQSTWGPQENESGR
jgi:hypothetical protein